MTVLTTPALPATMRAVHRSTRATTGVLSVRRHAVPRPGAHEVLLRVHAAGLNPKDVQLHQHPRRTAGTGLGFDVCGEVVAVGEDVDDLAMGERAWGFLDGARGGTVAEFVAIPRTWMSRAPMTCSVVEAAALPLVASTALQVLRDIARLRPGERVLVKGARGGVGRATVQLARAMGARVTAWINHGNVRALDELGADAIIDDAALKAGALREGVDVFVDCAGDTRLWRHRRVFSPTGRWIAVAANPTVFALAAMSPLLRPLRVPRLHYVIVRPRASDLAHLATLVEADALVPHVGDVLPMHASQVALRLLSTRQHPGKMVIAVSREAQTGEVFP